jgi:uncharacterized membrane-anchored protein YhcB (DUF1043 family)
MDTLAYIIIAIVAGFFLGTLYMSLMVQASRDSREEEKGNAI